MELQNSSAARAPCVLSLCREKWSFRGRSAGKVMKRDYYSDSIAAFLNATHVDILGQLLMNNDFPVEQTQRDT